MKIVLSFCPSPWVKGLCGGVKDRTRERANGTDKKHRVDSGLEPLTCRRSNRLSHELAQVNPPPSTPPTAFTKTSYHNILNTFSPNKEIIMIAAKDDFIDSITVVYSFSC